MDCSKSDPNNSLYKGGKWARTMSGYIALNAVSFSVCRLHRARSVETLHINYRKREKERERDFNLVERTLWYWVKRQKADPLIHRHNTDGARFFT